MKEEDLRQQLTSLGYSEETFAKVSGIVEDLYEFVRCQRPSGKIYGTRLRCRPPAVEIGPKREVPKGDKPKGRRVRVGKTVRSLSVGELESLLKDPRVKPHQAKKIQSLIEEKKVASKGQRVEGSKTQEGAKVEAPSKVIKKEELEQKSTKPSKFTDERVRETFNRAVGLVKESESEIQKLKKEGLQWGDPKLAAAYSRARVRRNAVKVLRETYHAIDRDSFIRETGKLTKVSRGADRMRDSALKELKRSGLSEYSLPEDHPLRKKLNEAFNFRYSETRKYEERAQAAYFGEPLKASKPKSDGGGKVDSSVPPSLPRGGASKELKDFLDGSEVVMAFNPTGFSKFVKQGEAKNGFESGTQGIKKGRAKAYLEARARGEEKVLDLSRGTEPKGRPVYAALENPERSRSLQGGSGRQMSNYGGIQVVLNDNVKDRSTFTVDDSLDYNSPRGVKASPVRDPANPKVVNSAGSREITLKVNGPSSQSMTVFNAGTDSNAVRPSYVEAQIHGGLRVDEVREVRYFKGHTIPPATLGSLKKMGIRVIELPPRMGDLSIGTDNPSYGDITTIEVN